MKLIRSYFKSILTAMIIVMTSFAVPIHSQAKGWETIRTERTDVKSIIRDSEIDIRAGKGVIQITTNKPQQVKIFTILGRLVNAETISAGTSQFLIKSHGVYIVKVGDLTAKIAC